MNQYHSFTGLNPLSPTLPFLSANVVAHLSPRDHRVYPPESPLRGGISAHVLLSVRRFVSLQSVVGWLLSLSAIFACVRGSLCPFNMSVTWGWHAMQNAPPFDPFTDAPGPHSHIANYLGLSQPWFGLLITWLRLQCVSSLSVALGTGHLLGFSDAIWPGLWRPFSDSLPFYPLKKKERYIGIIIRFIYFWNQYDTYSFTKFMPNKNGTYYRHPMLIAILSKHLLIPKDF